MPADPMRRLTGLSSMATRMLLADRVEAFRQATGNEVSMQSVGGVEAARRVRAGEAFDVIVLAADAIDKLQAEGSLAAGRRLEWVRSGVAAAVREGTPRPDISTEAALRQAVLDAPRIGYSTGPSGTALLALFERWGIAGAVVAKTVQAPPGVSVASLIAGGEVDLGFQQLSEMLGVAGITLLGGWPDDAQIDTTFSVAVADAASDVALAASLLDWLADPASSDTVRRYGMALIRTSVPLGSS